MLLILILLIVMLLVIIGRKIITTIVMTILNVHVGRREGREDSHSTLQGAVRLKKESVIFMASIKHALNEMTL